MHLSDHFTLEELSHSDTARAEGIPNQPTGAEVEALRALCQNVLEPLRQALGRSVKVNSGYRGPVLNRRLRLGNVRGVQHLPGSQSQGIVGRQVLQPVVAVQVWGNDVAVIAR